MHQLSSIRAATPGDATAIKAIAVDTGMFQADELDGFGEQLSGFFDGGLADHAWIVLEGADDAVIGAAYYAPEPFSDRMWNLYFIAVRPEHQASGAGGALIGHVEQALSDKGQDAARVLIVETSSLDGFALARRFYTKHGYGQEARIREFYGPGDHKIVFWKLLAGAGERAAAG